MLCQLKEFLMINLTKISLCLIKRCKVYKSKPTKILYPRYHDYSGWKLVIWPLATKPHKTNCQTTRLIWAVTCMWIFLKCSIHRYWSASLMYVCVSDLSWLLHQGIEDTRRTSWSWRLPALVSRSLTIDIFICKKSPGLLFLLKRPATTVCLAPELFSVHLMNSGETLAIYQPYYRPKCHLSS